MVVVAKVWIDEDCITCDACQDICPEVFSVTEESSQILAAVRVDGKFDRNTQGALLSGSFGADLGDIILEAAEACPVEVIKFELATDGAAPEAETSNAEAGAEVAATTAPAAAVAGVSEGLSSLLSGDRSLSIFFGSQTGNASGLAEKTAKLASNYGLEPTILDMDGYDPSKISSMKRVLIITSTWGEGEMPDNAENMWQAINSGNPSMSGVSYSVCALGDTSYDEYCKAGHDWNNKMQSLGGTQIHPIQECNVDYEPPWKIWVNEVLPRIACVDSSGTFLEDLVIEMIAYGSGEDDDLVEGDFSPTPLNGEQLSITLELFRYQPETGQQGWDTIECAVPAHASLEDLFTNIQSSIDGSFSFRRGNHAGSPITGVQANGRIVLSDMVRIESLVKNGGSLKVEPLPGHPIIRDLIVDMSHYERHRSRAEPWMKTDDRVGEYVANGSAMGTMEISTAVALHQMNSVHSFQYLQGMSDTLPHDIHYEGPGIHLQQWIRCCDPRTGLKQKQNLLESLNDVDGVWSEADLASIARQGQDGSKTADALNRARAALLAEYRYAGKHGRLVKWYGRSVKWSGKVNETTLYRQVLGPLGLVSNVFSGVSARMMLAFTRNGGPPIRSLQALLLPPAGVGRIPNMFNTKVDDHHEVVSIFNELDQRL